MCYAYFSLKLLVSNLIIIYQEIRVWYKMSENEFFFLLSFYK